MWSGNVKVTLIVKGALGTLPKTLKNHLNDFFISLQSFQKSRLTILKMSVSDKFMVRSKVHEIMGVGKRGCWGRGGEREGGKREI